MKWHTRIHARWSTLACVLGLLTTVASTGCQVSVGGQTLPSAYYISDDVQYFAKGPEFKLSREAAAMKEFQADQDLMNAGN